jgi:diguanylate cyclase (GGDEF)-like protein
MSSGPPSSPNLVMPARDRPPSSDRLIMPTPLSIELRDTQTALACARVAAERRTLTVISGMSAGASYTLDRPEHTIGRGEAADIRVLDGDVSRAHARLTRVDGSDYEITDLDSRNGTFVAGRPIRSCVLAVGDRIQCGPNLILRFAVTDDVEEELQKQMYASAMRDVLTHAYNRRYLFGRLAAEVAHARRHGGMLMLILFDLDHLARVNVEHGHAVGDIALRAVAARVGRLVRVEDVVARTDGGQFAVLTRSIDLLGAVALAERLRASIADIHIPADTGLVRLTASFGIAALSELGALDPADRLLVMASTRLRRAKARGGDSIAPSD